MATIYKGREAADALMEILWRHAEDGTYPYMKGTCGYFNDDEQDVWVAYDNTTGDCWVEEFKTEKEAKEYCYARE